ncbi:cytochrome C oxidase subunit IV family protein [Oscillochloris sp. ZM17-4]|nr:cytochrome C oxidase subunit IV family protein [Oscillochloris sp. ZM17-4]
MHHASHEGGHEREGNYGHISVRTYWMVFISLMALMALTVGAWYVEKTFIPGMPEIIGVSIAMAIAIAKTALIIYFFMHVKVSSRLTQVFAMSAFVWLAIMFVIIMGDYFSKGWPAQQGPLTQAPAPVAAVAPPEAGWRAL